MNTELELLLQKSDDTGHGDIAKALRKGQVEKVSDRQRMITAEASTCTKMARRGLDQYFLDGALLEITTSGWGSKPEPTELGLIQPLVNL